VALKPVWILPIIFPSSSHFYGFIEIDIQTGIFLLFHLHIDTELDINIDGCIDVLFLFIDFERRRKKEEEEGGGGGGKIPDDSGRVRRANSAIVIAVDVGSCHNYSEPVMAASLKVGPKWRRKRHGTWRVGARKEEGGRRQEEGEITWPRH